MHFRFIEPENISGTRLLQWKRNNFVRILSEMWYLLFFLFSFFFFFESAINSRHLLHELFINRELKLGNIYRSSSKLISGFHRVPCNEQSSIKRRNGPAVRCFHVLTNLVHYQTDSIFMLKVRTSKTGDYFQ